MADLFLIPYVRAVWRELAMRTSRERPMCIFGAGAHTRWLLDVTSDLRGPAVACILDDAPRTDFIGDIPVYQPSEINLAGVSLVLVSSDRWEEQLAWRCRQLFGEVTEIVRLYEGLPLGPYDKRDDRRDAIEASRRRRAERSVVNPEQVVVVCDSPGSRAAKIGYALKETGWSAVLLAGRTPTFDVDRCFDASATYSHAWEALRLACEHRPVAYHVMVNGDYRTAELLLEHRPGPIVLDSYDLISGMYTADFLAAEPALCDEHEREQRCLPAADGLCCRNLELLPTRRRMGRSWPDMPTLWFHDGCWDVTGPPPPPVRSRGAGELHVVHCGNVRAEPVPGEAASASACLFWLAELLARDGIHLHVYPSEATGGSFEERYQHYRELEARCPKFHLHRPVPPDAALIAELAGYDAGVHLVEDPGAPNATMARTWQRYTPDKLRYCFSNKLCDYLDAGLPVVSNVSRGYQAHFLFSNSVGVDLSAVPHEQWGRRIRQGLAADFGPAVHRLRSWLGVGGQAQRLKSFYAAVSDRQNGPRNEHEAQASDLRGHAARLA